MSSKIISPPNELRALRNARGMTLDQVAAATGISTAQVQKLEKRYAKLSHEYMRILAPAFDVRPSALMPAGDVETRLSSDETALLNAYRRLNNRGRQRFLKVAAALVDDAVSDDPPGDLDSASAPPLQIAS